MKKSLLAILVTLCVLSQASGQVKFVGGVHGGLGFSSFPKPANDYYGSGFLFGAHGEIALVKFLTLRLNIDYASFPSDKTKLAQLLAQSNGVAASDIVFSGLNTTDFSVFLDGLVTLPIQGSRITPYGLAGLGLNFLSASDGTLTYQGVAQPQATIKASESATKFGINFGAGSQFSLARTISLFIEVKYVLIFTDVANTSYIPIVVGVSFGV
jgi:Outer membrane protein beta-barrel domain